MALTESEVEKKSLTEISELVRSYEQSISEMALKVGAGQVKPAVMMTLNSELVMIKNVLNKKMAEQGRYYQRSQSKPAAPLKSYEDYIKGTKKK